MKMSNGEFLDRLSILILRAVHGDSQDLVSYLSEFKGKDAQTLVGLLEINNKIWGLESDIRQGKELGLEEVGRRAIAIRDLNKQRVRLKNEKKIDHASQ